MKEKKLMLSIRLRHPNIQAEDIVNNIKTVPVIARTGGKKYITPFGKTTNRINKETYVVYNCQEVGQMGLSDAIKAANTFLVRNIDYFNEFRKQGGKCDYYITLDSKSSYAFTLDAELVRDCAKIGIGIGVEVFAKTIQEQEAPGNWHRENLEQKGDNMEEKKLFLSITFEHATMSAEDIAINIDYDHSSKQTVGQKLTPPHGKPLEHIINKRTFVVYKLPSSFDNELELAIERANAFLSEHKDFLKDFYAAGGTVRCHITVISKKHYIFELPPELIKKTAELGTKLEIEIYAEERDEEDDDC
jgi:hypothetical protein